MWEGGCCYLWIYQNILIVEEIVLSKVEFVMGVVFMQLFGVFLDCVLGDNCFVIGVIGVQFVYDFLSCFDMVFGY